MNLLNFLRENINNILRILLFLASAFLIVLLFPRERKFKYEFTKNSPWMHENLIAKFDFPIYKPEEELTAEKDSILKEFKPYFNFKEEVVYKQISEFNDRFENEWKEYAKKNYGVLNENNPQQQKKKKQLYNLASSMLHEVYQDGIVEDKEILVSSETKSPYIFIIHDNLATEKLTTEVFDMKGAYEYILKQVEEHSKKLPPSALNKEIGFYKDLNLYDFIQPNLVYNAEKSKKAKESIINEISVTRGKILENELIISKGEIVNKENSRILESYKREYEAQMGEGSNVNIILLGHILIVVVSLLIIYFFLYNFRKEVLQNSWKTAFLLFLVTLMVLLASIPIKYDLFQLSFYIIPFAILPIVIRVFYDSRLALFMHVVTIMMIGFFAPNPYEHVFLNITAGIVALLSLTNLYRRDSLVIAAASITLTYMIVYFSFSIAQEGNITNIKWINFGWFAVNGVLILVTYPLIFVFEKSFGFLSDTTLMELSDTNQPLLRRLSEEAPGTFQHSMQVANLAEDAIRNIGGNPMLVRTGALYHDIGKMEDPLYFIENQTAGINPHDRLEFEESAKIIINHVAAGVKIARKYGLPEQIIDFIRTHHGTSTVHYFYRSFIKKYPELEVDVKKFSYPGPKPFSKETAVLMMADSIEAASRGLKNITEQTLDDLVDNIINLQMREEQLVNADITFKDITKIKNLFKKKLRNIYHARIEYPEEVT